MLGVRGVLALRPRGQATARGRNRLRFLSGGVGQGSRHREKHAALSSFVRIGELEPHKRRRSCVYKYEVSSLGLLPDLTH